MTDDTGRFQLQHPSGTDGASPGQYTVVISRLVDMQGNPIKPDPNVPPADLGAVESLPARYSDFTASTLLATVPEPSGEYTFELKTN